MEEKTVKRVAITGGAGQIGYQLLFRIASGQLFGPDQPVALHILETSLAIDSLKGVVMELSDCAFPLVTNIIIGSDPYEIFSQVDYALLVGAKPRGPGMERKDLLTCNGKIFVDQGKALDQVAKPTVKVFVVGNPCNTNCLIAMHQAKKIDRRQFFAMTRLDQNRAMYQLAKKAAVSVNDVSHMAIWGNHSATQVPDFIHAKIKGTPVTDVIQDKAWLEGEFITKVQKRGTEIINVRGKSSAASAASALLDAIRSILQPTGKEGWFSAAVCSDNNPYQISEGLIFSFPCTSSGNEDWSFVPGLDLSPFLEEKIKRSEEELLKERDLVREFM